MINIKNNIPILEDMDSTKYFNGQFNRRVAFPVGAWLVYY